MSRLSSWVVGPHVLKNAVTIEMPRISRNYIHGKKKVNGIPVKTTCWRIMV